LLALPASANGQTFHTLYSFKGPPDGRVPWGVVVDPATGDLYGTTRSGGIGITAPCPADSYGNVSDGFPFPGCGVVFKLSQGARGGIWTETLLYSFTGGADGAYPPAVPAPTLNNGTLYGATEFGGFANSTTCQTGCGTAFGFDLAAGTLQTVHTFSGGADSGGPYNGVVFDTGGNLYGDVEGGDGGREGEPANLVYELTPPPQGQTDWTFTALHPSSGGDDEIRSSLVVDKAGNLYGMTKQGALFELTPPTYAETTLYTFANGAAGVDQTGFTMQNLPDGGPVLYGITRQGGGPNNAGTVFKFDPATRTLTTLHTFTGGADGAAPLAPVVLDANGVLYGTTTTGGNLTNCPAVGGFPPGCGTVFKLDPATQTLTTLHAFSGGADGWGGGGVALGANGALYGTTLLGGDLTKCPGAGGFPPGCGTVFEIAAMLTATPSSGQAPLVVTFRASGLTLPMTYTLNFGDGTNGALSKSGCFGMPPVGGQGGIQCSGSASHTYTATGTYTATLLSALDNTLGTMTITVGGLSPPVVLTPTPASPPVATSPLTPERHSLDQ
jgi:uncharacterized repeat protein (TIGR03803 family)